MRKTFSILFCILFCFSLPSFVQGQENNLLKLLEKTGDEWAEEGLLKKEPGAEKPQELVDKVKKALAAFNWKNYSKEHVVCREASTGVYTPSLNANANFRVQFVSSTHVAAGGGTHEYSIVSEEGEIYVILIKSGTDKEPVLRYEKGDVLHSP